MDEPHFYRCYDDSIRRRGFPWLTKITEGLASRYCWRCKSVDCHPDKEIGGTLEPGKGIKWPDALGCGSFPLLILSERAIQAMECEGIRGRPIHEVCINPPVPDRLRATSSPRYFWIDGRRLHGARVDFEASGFVGTEFCRRCGRRWDNGDATYQAQHSGKGHTVICPRSWSGLHLFTTDISPTSFFCTERMVRCVAKHKLTNLRLVPILEGPFGNPVR